MTGWEFVILIDVLERGFRGDYKETPRYEPPRPSKPPPAPLPL
jgi:hypothetical protein